MSLIEKIREPKVLKAISEMSALKYPVSQIKEELKNKFKIDVADSTIKGVIKQFSIRGNMFLASEKDLANALKESILELLNESKENVRTLKELRDQLKQILQIVQTGQVLGDEDNGKKFRQYIGEIKDIIRTMDNSISTEKGVLELLDKQKKEFNLTAVQSIQMTKKDLEALEKAGMIVINPKYKKQITSEKNGNI